MEIDRQSQTTSQVELLWGAIDAQKRREVEEEWQERKRKKRWSSRSVRQQAPG